jgi:hypothetical protein
MLSASMHAYECLPRATPQGNITEELPNANVTTPMMNDTMVSPASAAAVDCSRRPHHPPCLTGPPACWLWGHSEWGPCPAKRACGAT